MNKWQLFLVVLITCWLASFFLPWYSFPLISFVCGLLWQGPAILAFWGSFCPTFIIILIQLLFISFSDQFRTATNIGHILGSLPSWSLLIIVPLIFALVSGLACSSGALIRQVLIRDDLKSSS